VYTANFVGVHHIVAVAAIGTVWLHRGRSPSVYSLFLVVALLASLGAGKWGAGESYYLESLAALSIVAAPFLAHAIQQRGTWLSAAAAAALVWQLGIYAHGERIQQLLPLGDLGFQAHALGARPSGADMQAGYALVETYVLKWDGPVLSEDAGFSLVARKPVLGNATHLRNLYDAGRWDAARLAADVEAQRFDFVILHAQLYPPPVLQAIGKHYYLHATVTVNGYNYQVFAPGAT